MCFFSLLGITGIYARQAKRAGWLGLAGYLLLSLWFVLIMGFSFVEAFILAWLATSQPAFVAGWLAVARRTRHQDRPRPTSHYLDGRGFAVHARRPAVRHLHVPSRHPARWAGVLLAVGAVLAPIAALLPNASQPKIAIPVGVALAWLGYALWSERRPEPVEPDGQPEADAMPSATT